jgi:hypothetical protein
VRDARHLARLLHLGEIVAVTVGPDGGLCRNNHDHQRLRAF